MPVDSSRRLSVIAAKLREAGDRELTNRTRRTLRAAAVPLKAKVRAAAIAQLPKSGGLNEQVAGQKVTVSVPLGVRVATVRLRTTAPDTKQTDSGYVRHPTFGARGKGEWIHQPIPQAAGWWSKTLKMAGPEITAALKVAMDTVAAEIKAL